MWNRVKAFLEVQPVYLDQGPLSIGLRHLIVVLTSIYLLRIQIVFSEEIINFEVTDYMFSYYFFHTLGHNTS